LAALAAATAARALAGDCGSPSDCQAIPDNATTATCIATGAAGIVAALTICRKLRKKRDESIAYPRDVSDDVDDEQL
jgi:hypothetical protein